MKNPLIWKHILIVVVLSIIICICPIFRPIDVEMQGAAYNSQDLQSVQDVTLRLKGHQRNYLLRDDVLDITLQLNDREMEFDRELFYFPEDGLYLVYFHYYEPSLNRYTGVRLMYDKDFSNVVVVLDEENLICAASVHEGATLEDLLELFARFLDNHRD